MSFQSTVNFRNTSGFLGQIILEVPHVVKSWRLDGQTASPNTFGKAFSAVADTVQVGQQFGSRPIPTATVGGTGPFAGILCNPAEFALSGSAAGTLAPSLDLPPYAEAQLITHGEVVVAFGTAVNYGDAVYFGEDGTLSNANGTLIAGAKVTNTIAGAGLTTVWLG